MTVIHDDEKHTVFSRTIFLLILINIFNYMDRIALSVLLPEIKLDLALSDSQLGWLGGIAFALFYAIFGLPIARLADSSNRKNIVSLSLVAWSFMTMLGGAASSFGTLFLTRVGVGIGEAGCGPASQSMIADLTSPAQRSKAMGWYSAGTTIGVMAGLSLGGWLSVEIGWRWTLVGLGAPGILLAALFYLTGVEPGRTLPGSAAYEQVSERSAISSIGLLLRVPAFKHLLLAFGAAAFSNGLLQWMPSFYMRTFDISPSVTGILFGFAFGIGSTIGSITGGYFASRLIKRDARWMLWQPAIAFALCAPFVLALCFSATLEMAISFNILYTLVAGFGVGPLMAAVLSVVPASQRAMAVALVSFAASILGLGLGPVFVGYLSDTLGSTGASNPLQLALATTAVFPVWAAIHLIIASQSFKTSEL